MPESRVRRAASRRRRAAASRRAAALNALDTRSARNRDSFRWGHLARDQPLLPCDVDLLQVVDPPLRVLIEAYAVVLRRARQLRGIRFADRAERFLVRGTVGDVFCEIGLDVRLQRKINEPLCICRIRRTFDDPPKLALTHRLVPFDAERRALID